MAMSRHLQTIKRPAFMINLDPAAEDFHYEPMIDIRNLISVQDVMEELHLGPNGGLMFCESIFPSILNDMIHSYSLCCRHGVSVGKF
jgi:hypothetical protein